MQFEELRYICQEAAVDVLRERGRPMPPTLVLPGSERTRLLTLTSFPDDDEDRHAVLAQVAADEVTPNEIPCWGFVSEAEVQGADAVVVVFGARRHAPHLTATRFDETGTGLEEFVPDEELDPTALPFLHPLQHAVDALPAQPADGPGQADADDPLGLGGPGPSGGLPQHP